ncbi:MAG: hypothetical protein SGVNAXEH_000337 [Holophagaceae bacterium]|jgi:hypothetical protein
MASLFIGGLLLLLSLAQGLFRKSDDLVFGRDTTPALLDIDNFSVEASLHLEPGWKPLFHKPQEPESEPLGSWGFGFPWESAAPFSSPHGFPLNGPGGRSKIYLWRNLEWRAYSYEAPIVSFRLNPSNNKQALVTFQFGLKRYETQLIDYPENRIRWSIPSGPWSRFSWDGRSVLIGFFEKSNRLLVSTWSIDEEPSEKSLAAYREPDFQRVPADLATRPDSLSDDGRDLPGNRIVLIWSKSHQMWFPRSDQLWVSDGSFWTLWHLNEQGWKRTQGGAGQLIPQFPDHFRLVTPLKNDTLGMVNVDEKAPLSIQKWDPSRDPLPQDSDRWFWKSTGAISYEGERWGSARAIPRTRWAEELREKYKAETQRVLQRRPELRSDLLQGPRLQLLEAHGKAWVWVGDEIYLLNLLDTSTTRAVRSWFR